MNRRRRQASKRSNTTWKASAIALIVLSMGAVSQLPASAATATTRTASAKQLLNETEGAFAAASSVAITGFVRAGNTVEDVDISVLSDGDGSYSLKVKSAKAQITIVAGAVYFYANAAFLQKYGHYSPTQAAAYADTWLQEGSLDAANIAAGFSFDAILKSIAHPGGKLTKTAARKLNGVSVVGLRSSRSGYLYIATSPARYPVEMQSLKKGVHEVLRFSGWNAQTEPAVPVSEIKAGSNESVNWSGYVLPTAAGSVTEVSGNWTIPSANCFANPNTHSSSWVGIDGELNGTVLQTGTETDCQKGQQVDYGWFENYPSPPIEVTLAVHPGDVINGQLQQVSPSEWSYTLSDLTSGQVVTSPAPIAYQGPGSSAEWIEEDPGGEILPLTNFGSVLFSNLTVDGAAPTMDPSDNDLNMIQNGVLEAQPSQFFNDAFSVSFQ